MEKIVGREVSRSEEIVAASEGMRHSQSFGTTLSRLIAILTIASRGWPSLSTGIPESLSIRRGSFGKM